MTVTIYHTRIAQPPATRPMIRQSGETPHIVEYLKAPPDRATLVDLIERMRLSPRELLCRKGTP